MPSPLRSPHQSFQPWPQQLHLRTLLIVPFVLLTVGAVAWVGYLSYRSGKQATAELAHQLMTEVGDRITQKLDDYLQSAWDINQVHVAALDAGVISFERSDQLHRFLALQLLRTDAVSSLLFATPQGDFRFIHRVNSDDIGINTNVQPTDLPFEFGVANSEMPSRLRIYSIDGQGNMQRQLETIENVDGRERPWYQQAVAAGQPGWSTPFQIGRSNQLAINSSVPIYDQSGQLQGVISVNFSLQQLDQFLQTLSIGQSGQVFIMERNGLILANSTGTPNYTSHPYPPPAAEQLGPDTFLPGLVEFRRLAALDSPTPLIRAAAQQLVAQFGSLESIHASTDLAVSIDGDRHFLQVIPYQDNYGLDWLVVMTVPEADFMGAVYENVRRTAGLSALTLLGVVLLGISMTRWITRPILRLSQVAQTFSVDAALPDPWPIWIREVESLRRAFYQMANRLHYSFQSLKTSEQRFSTFLEKLPMGVSIHDATGQVTFVNHQGLEILTPGATPTLIPQLSQVYQLYVAGTNQLYPTEQLPAVRGLSGESAYINDMEVDVNGQRVPIEVHTIPIFDDQGKVLYVINAFQDISERRRAEQLLQNYQQELEWEVAEKTQALRQSETKLKAAQRIAQVGNWEFDLNSKTVTWSEEIYRIYEADPQTFMLRPDTMIQRIHPEDLDRFQQTIINPIHIGQTFDTDLKILTQTGKTHYIQVKGEPIANHQGKISKWVGTVADITHRKQAELQIQSALLEKEILLQEIHHRVKNNLQLIQSMLQMQQRRMTNLEATQVLQDSQDRIMAISLAHEILYQSSNLGQLDLADYLPTLIDQIYYFFDAQSQPVTLKRCIESAIVPIKTAICCGLVVNELVTNSLKYAFPEAEQPHPGIIEINLTVDNISAAQGAPQGSDRPIFPTLHIIVRDNGIGLPPDFDLHQVNSLGMVLVQAFTDQIHGTLSLTSAPNQGTQFEITVPLKVH
jgi:PAS domain S-box-containing protein